MFYLTTQSTHFIYSYMASDKVKDHSDSKRGNLLPHRLLFPISSKGSERITHIKAFDMAGTRNSSMGFKD